MGRFVDGTAMHTLTNTRPTDRYTYVQAYKTACLANEIFLFIFLLFCCFNTAHFPSPNGVEEKEGAFLFSFTPQLCASIHGHSVKSTEALFNSNAKLIFDGATHWSFQNNITFIAVIIAYQTRNKCHSV